MVECLNFLFEDIATSTCLAGLTMPLSELPGDAPAAQMFEACMKCTAGNAKPVDAVLKSDSDETAWPGASLVPLACDILKMLASREMCVGVRLCAL